MSVLSIGPGVSAQSNRNFADTNKIHLNVLWTAEVSVDKIYFKSLAESLIYKSHLSQFLTAQPIMFILFISIKTEIKM